MSHRLSILGLFLLCASAPAGAQPEDRDRTEQIRAVFGMDRETFSRELERRFQYEAAPPPRVVEEQRDGQALDAAHFQSFPGLDRSYSAASRAKASRMAAELARSARQVTHEQFVLGVAEITALADNSHTAVSENALRKGTPRISLRTLLFATGSSSFARPPSTQTCLGHGSIRSKGAASTQCTRGSRAIVVVSKRTAG